MKRAFFLRLTITIFALCIACCFAGCDEKKNAEHNSPTKAPYVETKGEHYEENMLQFGDFIKELYPYECIYQYHQCANKELAVEKAVTLKKKLLFAINNDFYLESNEKELIKKNAEDYLTMQYHSLGLNCEETNQAITKELFGISFDEYTELRLCEALVEKSQNEIKGKYLSQQSILAEAEQFYKENQSIYDFVLLRYISFKLNTGGSSSSNQSITKQAESLCNKLKTIEDMLNIIGGENDKQSHGTSNGQVTLYLNETDSLFFEFAQSASASDNPVNSKAVVHDKNNAYVIMCEGLYTWENSQDIKDIVKDDYAKHKAEEEMLLNNNVNYSEPENWYNLTNQEKITVAKDIDDYSSVIALLDVAEAANTVFLTIQQEEGTTACDFYAFNKIDGQWKQLFKTLGYVGRSGIEDPANRFEGNGTTPSGVYSFGMLFGINDNPGELQKDYKKLDEDDYWDGDRYSDTYNQYVKGSEMPSSWNRGASEHLIDYTYSYNYAAMINFNVNPTIKGKGSAIFMHCTRPGALSSAGCVSIPQDKMIKALRMIDDNSYIVIVEKAEDIKNYF